MRTRIDEQPPDRDIINRILAAGPADNERDGCAHLLERLRKSCYLDPDDRPLNPAGRLLAQYRTDGLVLFLGAGVSLCSGIPSWPRLAKEVLLELGLNYGEVRWACPSLIAQFDLARRANGVEEFTRALYKCLYRNTDSQQLIREIPKRLKDQSGWNRWPAVLDSLRKNDTLEAVGELLITDDEMKDGDLVANRQIHAVLTTNADNLLEVYRYARTQGRRRLLTMVDRASLLSRIILYSAGLCRG